MEMSGDVEIQEADTDRNSQAQGSYTPDGGMTDGYVVSFRRVIDYAVSYVVNALPEHTC